MQEDQRPQGPNRERVPEGAAHPLDRNRGMPTPGQDDAPTADPQGRDVTEERPDGERGLESPWLGGG